MFPHYLVCLCCIFPMQTIKLLLTALHITSCLHLLQFSHITALLESLRMVNFLRRYWSRPGGQHFHCRNLRMAMQSGEADHQGGQFSSYLPCIYVLAATSFPDRVNAICSSSVHCDQSTRPPPRYSKNPQDVMELIHTTISHLRSASVLLRDQYLKA